MNKYIDAERLKKSIGYYMEGAHAALNPTDGDADYYKGKIDACEDMQELITSLQKEQPVNIIQWTGNNLKEVIDFTGKSPRFEEWFKSWEEFETYVHQHSDILKLFCEDGSHYEVPKGAWIVKTPDGYNLPSVAKYIQHPSIPSNLDEAAIQAAQIDICDRQIMEASNDERLRYSRIFRRGFKAGAGWLAGQGGMLGKE